MNEPVEFVLRAVFIGAAATIILDMWSALLASLGVEPTNWAMVGRWIGNFPRGRFTHARMAEAPPVRGELALGWATHYAVGIVYAGLLLAIVGLDWARAPTLLPALVFGLATIVAPFFIMQPAMGAGVAASRTPNPTAARLKSLTAHTVFGLALYAAAKLATRLM